MMKYAAQFPAQGVSQPWQFSRHFYNTRKTHLAFFSHFVSIPPTGMSCGAVVGCCSALGFVLENYLQLHFIRKSVLHFHREKRRRIGFTWKHAEQLRDAILVLSFLCSSHAEWKLYDILQLLTLLLKIRRGDCYVFPAELLKQNTSSNFRLLEHSQTELKLNVSTQ